MYGPHSELSKSLEKVLAARPEICSSLDYRIVDALGHDIVIHE